MAQRSALMQWRPSGTYGPDSMPLGLHFRSVRALGYVSFQHCQKMVSPAQSSQVLWQKSPNAYSPEAQLSHLAAAPQKHGVLPGGSGSHHHFQTGFLLLGIGLLHTSCCKMLPVSQKPSVWQSLWHVAPILVQPSAHSSWHQPVRPISVFSWLYGQCLGESYAGAKSRSSKPINSTPVQTPKACCVKKTRADISKCLVNINLFVFINDCLKIFA